MGFPSQLGKWEWGGLLWIVSLDKCSEPHSVYLPPTCPVSLLAEKRKRTTKGDLQPASNIRTVVHWIVSNASGCSAPTASNAHNHPYGTSRLVVESTSTPYNLDAHQTSIQQPPFSIALYSPDWCHLSAYQTTKRAKIAYHLCRPRAVCPLGMSTASDTQ